MATKAFRLITPLVSLCLASTVTAAAPSQTADVILVGATGNLAGKYLWRAMLNLDLVNRDETDIAFYGAGRDVQEKGKPIVDKFLDTKINCKDKPDLCTDEKLEDFKSRVSYVQLKKAEHYAELCSSLNTKHKASGRKSVGRLFYLSIPPFAYADIAKTIKEVCTPPDGDTWLRVAFEKPFGEDLKSAETMAASLAEHLKEDQIYRFDHYLGKIGVQQITDFRKANPSIDKFLNSENVVSISVEMTETEDCAGRSGFYDKYGVMRDIHQNHLMEVLVLALMDLEGAADPEVALKAKATVISKLEQALPGDALVAQYDKYIDHVQEDLKDMEHISKTPTFAMVQLRSESSQWKGTTLILTAGKQLNQRQAEMSIKFKDGGVIVFHIQGGTPAVGPTTYLKTTGSFLEDLHIELPNAEHWTHTTDDERIKNGEFTDAYRVGPGPDLPYNRLVAAMFAGEQSEFVGTAGLLESWRVWDKVVKVDTYPEVYEGGVSYKEVVLQLLRSKYDTKQTHDGDL